MKGQGGRSLPVVRFSAVPEVCSISCFNAPATRAYASVALAKAGVPLPSSMVTSDDVSRYFVQHC